MTCLFHILTYPSTHLAFVYPFGVLVIKDAKDSSKNGDNDNLMGAMLRARCFINVSSGCVISRLEYVAIRSHLAALCASHDVQTDPDEIDTDLFEKFSSSSSEKIVSMEKDQSKWYQQGIACADLIDVSPVRGCMVLKPNGFAIWEEMKADLDKRFKATGHRNVYFPLFIPQTFLSKEAEHVEGFAKECAVVTHRLRSVTDENGNKGVEPHPAAKLEELLIVRPTSETIIWNMYGRLDSILPRSPRIDHPMGQCGPLGDADTPFLEVRRISMARGPYCARHERRGDRRIRVEC